jgi:hypothetical protein
MRIIRPGGLVGVVVLAALAGGTATASGATSGPDCCFAPARTVSGPVPAGDVRFGAVAGGFANVVVRQANGSLLVASYVDGRFGPMTTLGSWPYRELQLGDVDGDGIEDLVGGHGAGAVVFARATGEGFGPPAPLVRVPRAYSVLRIGDTNADQVVDVVGLDPGSRAIRVLQVPRTTAADTFDDGPWPKGLTFRLADVDGDERADVVGVDGAGRVRVAFNNSAGVTVAHAVWRLPAHVSLSVDDVTGDGRADLVYRLRGSDDVFVRRAYDATIGARTSTGFHTARRWGRWDRRLALTTADLGGTRASLAARDPQSGRIMVALSRPGKSRSRFAEQLVGTN